MAENPTIDASKITSDALSESGFVDSSSRPADPRVSGRGPIDPQTPDAPDVRDENQPAPGSLADKLAAAFLGHLAANTPKPPAPTPIKKGTDIDRALNGPQTTGDYSEVMPAQPPPPSRGHQAVSNILSSLSDAAAAQDAASPVGAAFATLKAGQARREHEQDRRVMTAKANADMLHQQRLLHNQDIEQMNTAASSGRDVLKVLESPVSGIGGAQTTYRNQTSDQLKNLLAQGKLDPSTQTVFHTGNIQEGTNPDGTPRMRATYSVVTLGGDVKFEPENEQAEKVRTLINQYSPKDNQIPQNQVLDSAVINSMYQSAINAKTAQDAMDYALEKGKIAKAELDNEDQHFELLRDPMVVNAMSQALNDGGSAAFAPIRAYFALRQNSDFMKKYPSFDGATLVGNKDQWKTMVGDFTKAQEKKEEGAFGILEYARDPSKMEGHTSAAIAAANQILDPKSGASAEQRDMAQRVKKQAQDVRALELDMEGSKELTKDKIKRDAAERSNPSGLTGEAFIKTLPPGRAAALKAISEGSIAVNPAALERTDKGQAFMDDIYSAYPDFQAYKGIEWPKAYADAMTNGKVYQAKNNYNTALQHMADIYNTSTFDGLFNPLSQDYRDRHAAIAIVTGEMAKAVKAGVATQAESDDLKEALSGSFKTPQDARERSVHQAGLLKEKIDEYQTQFQAAAPSAFIKVPVLISPRAQSAFDFMSSGGRTPQALQEQREKERAQATHKNPGKPTDIVRPADLPTATGIAPDPKTGKMYWHDIQGKPLREYIPQGAQ